MSLPPFPPDYRAAGVLLHVTSLPSPYGVGDVGGAALAWIDHLREAGQSWWQVLPLGPTGYGDSPYQSLSSFAGNELLVSPDWLIEDGLLRVGDCEGARFSPDAVAVLTLAGEPITAKLTNAPGNNAPIGGLKVVAARGWFAARPSGTESIYKIYAESFKDQGHLDAIVSEAQAMVSKALESA